MDRMEKARGILAMMQEERAEALKLFMDGAVDAALDRQREGIAMMVHVALTLTIQKHGMISREMVDDLAKDIRAYAGEGEEEKKTKVCHKCGGMGAADLSENPVPCRVCRGTGEEDLP